MLKTSSVITKEKNMKSIVFLLTILITLPSLASIWTETVTCEFNRISEDNTVVKSDISANFTVQGTHMAKLAPYKYGMHSPRLMLSNLI